MHYCGMSDGFVPWESKSEGKRPRKHPFPQTTESVRINLTRKPHVIKFSEEHPEFDGNITTMFFFLLNHYQKTSSVVPPVQEPKVKSVFGHETLERFIRFKSATNGVVGMMTGDNRFNDLEKQAVAMPGISFSAHDQRVITFDQMLQLLLDYAEADPACQLPTGQPITEDQKQQLCFPLESSVTRIYTEMQADEKQKKEGSDTGTADGQPAAETDSETRG